MSKQQSAAGRVVVPRVPDEPEVTDELVIHYLALAHEQGLVFAQVVAQLLDKLYRDDDFYKRRQLKRQQSGYDKGLLYDMRALAWLIRACQLYVPEAEQRQPLPDQESEQPTDPRAAELAPDLDVLLHVNHPDQVLNYYVSLARGAGVVYALAIKLCIKRLYQDHAYLLRRQAKGVKTDYDPKLAADMRALAWLLTKAAQVIPDDIKRHPIPPLPPRPNRRQPQTAKAKKEAKRQRQQHDILYYPQPQERES